MKYIYIERENANIGLYNIFIVISRKKKMTQLGENYLYNLYIYI